MVATLDGAYTLLNERWDYDEEYQAGIRRQMTFVIENPRILGRLLNIFQIMKSLETLRGSLPEHERIPDFHDRRQKHPSSRAGMS